VAICPKYAEIEKVDIEAIEVAIADIQKLENRLLTCGNSAMADAVATLGFTYVGYPTPSKKLISAASVVAGISLTAYSITAGYFWPLIWVNPAVTLNVDGELTFKDSAAVQKYNQWQGKTSWLGTASENREYLKDLVKTELRRILDAETKDV